MTIVGDARRFADDPALGWNQLGIAFVVLGQLEDAPDSLIKATDAYRKALAHRPNAFNKVRISINLAAALFELGSRTPSAQRGLRTRRLRQAQTILEAVLHAGGVPLPDRSRAEDNLGLVLSALGGSDQIQAALAAFGRALKTAASQGHRARTLGNRGTAYLAAEQYNEAYRDFTDALVMLPANAGDTMPREWSRLKHNQGEALVGLGRSAGAEQRQLFTEAVQEFAAARARRDPISNAMLWGVTTVGLAGALAELGASHCRAKDTPDQTAGIIHLYRALALLCEAVPVLSAADKVTAYHNIEAISRALRQSIQALPAEYRSEEYGLTLIKLLAVLANCNLVPAGQSRVLMDLGKNLTIWRDGLPPNLMLQQIGSSRDSDAGDKATLARKRRHPVGCLPELPAGLSWPTETFSEAHRLYGWDIVRYLDERWSALIKAGVATRRILASRDPSAITAIKNYTRRQPGVHERRRLPDHLHFPTYKEVNDRALAGGIAVIKYDPRLAQVVASRIRQKIKVPGL